MVDTFCSLFSTLTSRICYSLKPSLIPFLVPTLHMNHIVPFFAHLRLMVRCIHLGKQPQNHFLVNILARLHLVFLHNSTGLFRVTNPASLTQCLKSPIVHQACAVFRQAWYRPFCLQTWQENLLLSIVGSRDNLPPRYVLVVHSQKI